MATSLLEKLRGPREVKCSNYRSSPTLREIARQKGWRARGNLLANKLAYDGTCGVNGQHVVKPEAGQGDRCWHDSGSGCKRLRDVPKARQPSGGGIPMRGCT